MNFRFAPEAADELAEAAAWYDGRVEGLGRRLVKDVHALLLQVAERPRSFPRLLAIEGSLEVRRAPLANFPYALVFLAREHDVRVLAVAHVKRRPDYWLSRVEP